MTVNELNYEQLVKALEEYKKTTYYHYYNKNSSIIEDIEENKIFFNDDGTILGEYRICSHCGEKMIDGFVIYDGDYYYCSEKCLHQHFTEEKYLELYEEDAAYWTQWY